MKKQGGGGVIVIRPDSSRKKKVPFHLVSLPQVCDVESIPHEKKKTPRREIMSKFLLKKKKWKYEKTFCLEDVFCLRIVCAVKLCMKQKICKIFFCWSKNLCDVLSVLLMLHSLLRIFSFFPLHLKQTTTFASCPRRLKLCVRKSNPQGKRTFFVRLLALFFVDRRFTMCRCYRWRNWRRKLESELQFTAEKKKKTQFCFFQKTSVFLISSPVKLVLESRANEMIAISWNSSF